MQLKPNTLLKGGEFRIIKSLGRGGFGITYLAEQISLNNRKVCIKEFFPSDYYRREDDTQRAVAISDKIAADMNVYKQKFYKEATTIAEFNHNNIIKIYDVFRENDTVYYAMEYIDGCSLRDITYNKKPLSKGRALKYIRETAMALAHIHSKKSVHLDIKPANIMVREDDDSVVVIDFGLSKHYNEDGTPTTTTPGGFSIGYTPLEMYQTQMERQLLPPTDIYSLGATLYTMLTGEVPPEAPDVMISGVPKHDRLDTTMYAFIAHTMSPKPDNRPPNIEEFLKLLGDEDETNNGGIKKAVNSHFNEVIRLGITINSNRSRQVVTNIYLDGKRCFKLISARNRVGIYRVYSNNFALNKILSDKSRYGYQILPGKSYTLGNDPEKITQLISELVYPYTKVTYNTSAKLRNEFAFLSILIVFAYLFLGGSCGIWAGLLYICDYTISTEMIIIGVVLQILLIALFLTIVIKILRGKRVSKG